MDGTVYKVLSRVAFTKTLVDGRFEGSGEDARDGFIHLSSAEQLEDTLAKHYAGKDGLVLLAVDSESLGERLQWEPARGGGAISTPLRPARAQRGELDRGADARGRR